MSAGWVARTMASIGSGERRRGIEIKRDGNGNMAATGRGVIVRTDGEAAMNVGRAMTKTNLYDYDRNI